MTASMPSITAPDGYTRLAQPVFPVDQNGNDGSSGPAYNGVAVTPSDSTVIEATRGVWVGGAGNINVVFAGGNTILLYGVAAGTLLPIAVTKVMSTSTTATLIVALY